jgi:hypothetical protein
MSFATVPFVSSSFAPHHIRLTEIAPHQKLASPLYAPLHDHINVYRLSLSLSSYISFPPESGVYFVASPQTRVIVCIIPRHHRKRTITFVLPPPIRIAVTFSSHSLGDRTVGLLSRLTEMAASSSRANANSYRTRFVEENTYATLTYASTAVGLSDCSYSIYYACRASSYAEPR